MNSPRPESASAPKLSVVTVVWNDPEGLSRTFRSLLDLVPAEKGSGFFEHLVIDSSPDRHGEAYAGLPDGYPLVRVEFPKSGVYPAMNEGIRVSRGEIVWFLNAGDTLCDPAALRDALTLLEGEGRSVLGGPVLVSGPAGEVRIPCPDFAKGTFGKNKICHQAVLYPRELLREFGGYEGGFPIAADFRLHLKLHLGGVKLVQYRKPLARFETGGISSRIIPAMKEFSRVQLSLNRGPFDAAARQLSLAWELLLILGSRTLRVLAGDRVHHALKQQRWERK